MKKKNLSLVLTIIIGVTSLIGCSSSTPTDINPLNADEESKNVAIVNIKGDYVEYDIARYLISDSSVKLVLEDGYEIKADIENVIIMPKHLLKSE